MLKNSQLFTNAIKDDVRRMRARVTINNIVYDESVINSIDFQSSALSGEQLEIGSTHAASVKIEFSEVIETIVALDKVVVELGVKREEFPLQLKQQSNVQLGRSRMGTRLNLWNSTEDIEYSLLGEFYISDHVDINYNDKITSIDCKDKTIFLEDTYESELEYPTDIRDVITEVANMAGVEIDALNIEELETIQIEKIEGFSYRETLSFIAQLLPGFVYFNHKGLLQIRTMVDSEYQISMDEYFSKGLQKNGIRYKVRGLTCTIPAGDETEVLFVGSKKGPQVTIENPIMTQELLVEVYERLQKVDYYPYDLNWRGNPALEIGDLITVHDAEGNELKVPNLNYRLQYNGGLSAESGADTKSRTEVVPSGRVPLQQQIHNANQNIRESATKLQSAFKNAQDRITGNQGGYIVQRMNEDDKPYEFLVMDTEDINSASNVIRLNQQGIGFSQNGYNGPFGVAITIDGQIVADYITAGTLRAVMLESADNPQTNYWDLSSGDFRLGNENNYLVWDRTTGRLEMTWEDTDTSISIGNGSLTSTAEDGSQTYVQNGIVGFRNPQGASLGHIGYIDAGSSPWYNINTSLGTNFSIRSNIRMGDGSTYPYQVLQVFPGSSEMYINLDDTRMRSLYANAINVDGRVDMTGYSGGRIIQGANTLRFQGGGDLRVVSDNSRMHLESSSQFNLWSNGSRVFYTDSSHMYMNRTLSMEGNNITNQSDIRLKEHIKDAEVSGIDETKRLRMVEFNWKKDHPATEKFPTGKQFGMIAQDTPFLSTQDQADNHYMSIDMFKQINLATLTNQELIEQNEQQEEKTLEIETELNNLKQLLLEKGLI